VRRAAVDKNVAVESLQIPHRSNKLQQVRHIRLETEALENKLLSAGFFRNPPWAQGVGRSNRPADQYKSAI
jgi:hypothetical protein